MNNDIKFFFFPYDGRPLNVFSQKTQSYYISDDISNIVWVDPYNTIPGYSLTINDVIENFPKQDGKKEHRPIIMLFDVTRYPVMEQVGYDKWNGCIRFDLDLDEEHTGIILTDEDIDKIYYAVKVTLKQYFGHNWLYIEHSSSGKGIHIILYYDIEIRNEANFFACAEYSKNHFLQAIKSNSPRLYNLLLMKGVFDPVYRKLYQKTYITLIDHEINENCSGFILQDILENFIKEQEEKLERSKINQSKYKPGQYEIISSSEEKFNIIYDHTDRFKIATALKAATSSKEQWEYEHAKICNRYKLYKNYTVTDFIKAFDYDKLDASKIGVDYLEKLGIIVNKKKWTKTLNSNEYLGDVLPEILGEVEPGCNLIIAPTGSGKTVSWINYHKEIFNKVNGGNIESLFSFDTEKPILIIEPLNSIIETKYDPNECHIITGNKQFPSIITQYGLYITNYNKLIEKRGDEYIPRGDLKSLIRQFRFIVIDESHIVIKDCFRNDVLQAFTNAINSINEIPIILQTATPMDEEKLFTIQKQFVVKKASNKDIKYIFRYIPEKKFELSMIENLVIYYVNTGRKVYIYWNNGPLQKMKIIYKLFPGKAAIFHKRSEYGDSHEDMEYIKVNHALNDEYDVLISSVYFGVGNDLNDKGKAAVIIIGNNTWQEDIQAIGRFRNSTDIEVCQVILPNEIQDILSDYGKDPDDYQIIYENRKRYFNNVLIDRYNKNKSVIIKNTEYKLTNINNLHIYTVMAVSEIFHSNIRLKINKLREYDIDVRVNFDLPIQMNKDFHDKTIKHAKEIKETRNKKIKEIMEGKTTYDNSDTRLCTFAYIWNKAKKIGLIEVVGPKYLTMISNYEKIKMFLQYFRDLEKQKTEYSELYSYILVRDKIRKLSKNQREETLKVIGDDDLEITRQDYFIAIGYAIFCKYKNLSNELNTKVFNNYFKKYRKYALWWIDFEDEIIDFLFQKTHKTGEMEKFESSIGNIFLGDLKRYDKIDAGEDLKNLIAENLGVDINLYLRKCFKTLKAGRPEGITAKQRSDKGKKHKKKPVIIDGKVYISREAAAKKLGKSLGWVDQHKEKNTGNNIG